MRQHLVLREPRLRRYLLHLRLALGQRPGLVDHQRVDLLHQLERFGVLDEHAFLCPAPDADDDGYRCGEAQRARAGDDEHRDGDDQCIGQRRRRADQGPHRNRNGGDGDDGQDEPAGDQVGKLLDRCARTTCLAHHVHDAREQRICTHLLGAHRERPGLIDGAAGDLAAGDFLGRDGLTGQHRLVDAGLAVDDLAVDWNLGAGFHAQDVAGDHVLEADFLVGSVRLHPNGGVRCKAQQVLDGARRLRPRPQLEHLAEQHQGHDDRGGLEVQRQSRAQCETLAASSRGRRWHTG